MTAASPDQPNPMPEPTAADAASATTPGAAKPGLRPLRAWPAIVLVAGYWILLQVLNATAGGTMEQFMAMMFAPMVVGLLLVIFWLTFSRAGWIEKLVVLVTFIGSAFAVSSVAHKSMGMSLLLSALPVSLTCWSVAILLFGWLGRFPRTALICLVIAGTWGFYSLLRMDGVAGNVTSAQMSWRWSETPEDRFLKTLASSPSAGTASKDKPAASDKSAAPLTLGKGDWAEFRGPNRDSKLTGVKIASNWTKAPPKLLWKHLIGPGWSAFSVVGDYAFTQEQRGGDEAVVCYDANTGEQRWLHVDQTRFEESVAGPGPRATPTFHNGKLYTLGANGDLNCFDARSGEVLWHKNVKTDTGRKTVPEWGFSASPLVVDGLVTVYVGGDAESLAEGAPGEKGAETSASPAKPAGGSTSVDESPGVIAYSAETGEIKWKANAGMLGYSSTHLAEIDGVPQLLISSNSGLKSLDTKTGTLLWNYPWELQGMARIVQPAVVSSTGVILGTGYGQGSKYLDITRKEDFWSIKETWTSRNLKPYFNDFVVHKDHIYGFDHDIFTCVDLATGKRKWKQGRYGNGQCLLLADQDLLLILSEEGDVVLLEANPAAHTEVGQFHAIDGKTWNHPVVANGKLFVRNGEEAACYQLNLWE